LEFSIKRPHYRCSIVFPKLNKMGTRRSSIFVITNGIIVYGTYTNLLAAHTKINNFLKTAKSKLIPSYSTVYRNFKSVDGPIGFDTGLGRFVITESPILKKGH